MICLLQKPCAWCANHTEEARDQWVTMASHLIVPPEVNVIWSPGVAGGFRNPKWMTSTQSLFFCQRRLSEKYKTHTHTTSRVCVCVCVCVCVWRAKCQPCIRSCDPGWPVSRRIGWSLHHIWRSPAWMNPFVNLHPVLFWGCARYLPPPLLAFFQQPCPLPKPTPPADPLCSSPLPPPPEEAQKMEAMGP